MRGTEQVQLLQPVGSVSAVYGFDDTGRRVDYAQGADWELVNGRIRRTPASRIPDFSTYRYVASQGDRFDFASQPRNPPVSLGFDVYIDYVSPLADRTVTVRPLPRAAHHVLCLGDSIGNGAHTVSNFATGSDGESWCGLLRQLLAPFGGIVTNASSNSGVTGRLVQDLDQHAAIGADTVIIEFGMNDHVLEPAGGVTEFRANLDRAITRFRMDNANVILVGFFAQNPLWLAEDPAKTQTYNQAIRDLAAVRGVPFIDVADAFTKAVPPGAVPGIELTGDFMHHPNTYGQRIYFSLLAPYFLAANTPASTIPNYVVGPWTN